MIGAYLIRKGIDFFFKSVFFTRKTKKTEGLISVARGKVISVNEDTYFEKSSSLIDEGEDSEVYLHIKTSPLSSKIHSVGIINKEDMVELKKISDDLLNIYLPISKPFTDPKKSESKIYDFYHASLFEANFINVRQNNDKPFACYFNEGDIYITGYLLSENSIPNRIKEPNTISDFKNGDALVLEVSAVIGDSFFSLQNYEVRRGTRKECFIESHEEIRELDGSELDEVLVQIKIVYPLGFVEDGNFIHGRKPNNISIFKDNTSHKYFIGEELFQPEGSLITDPCPVAVFAERRKFYITID